MIGPGANGPEFNSHMHASLPCVCGQHGGLGKSLTADTYGLVRALWQVQSLAERDKILPHTFFKKEKEEKGK